MRLAAKLVLLFLVGMLLIVSIFAYLTVQLDRRLAISEHERRAAELAEAVQRSAPISGSRPMDLDQSNGPVMMRVRETSIRLVFLDTGDDDFRPMVPPSAIVTKREITTVRVTDPSGFDRYVSYIPYHSKAQDNDNPSHLEISTPDPGAADRVRRSLISSLVALLGVATLSGFVIVLGGIKMVGKPLNKLIDKVHRVGQGDFSKPVVLQSTDELGKLGLAINEMCEQLDTQRRDLQTETASRIKAVEQLRHAERLNMVGRMAAGIAHEIGTPLNVVSGRAELIAGGELTDEATRQSAQAIQSEAQRITTIVRNLLDFARQSTPKRSRQNLNDLLSVTVDLMEPLATKHEADIKLELPTPPLYAEVDPAQIQQVLTNLIVNAVHTTTEKGLVRLKLESVRASRPDESGVEASDSSPSLHCCISVSDQGQGIESEDMQHIFEPFFTTKDVGEGTGLGLSISHGIIQEHEGWIEVQSTPDRGSTFKVFLPACQNPEN